MKHLLLAATVFALALGSMPLRAQTGQQTFQQALVAERAKGDLQEAIKLYERAAKEAGADRALAAKSLLAAARCYEKLGQDGARKVYAEIAKAYGDQREQAAQARERLAALAGPAKSPDHSEGLTTRQLAVPPSATLMQLTRTGTEVVYVHAITGNLMVWDTTRKVARVVLAQTDGRHLQSFSLAPNGRDIVVQRQARRAAGAQITDAPVQFCVTTLDGGACRVVFEQPAVRLGQPVRGWSPDSRRFLAMIREQDSRVMVAMDAADGSIRKLATIGAAEAPRGGRALSNLSFLYAAKYSPDGKYVAWTQGNLDEAPATRGKLHIAAADGTGEGLVDENSSNQFLEWTPDGRHILFLSNRDGQQSLFVQGVTGGKTSGPARLVSRIPSEVSRTTMLPDGTFVYATRDARDEIYTTDIDPDTGAFVGDLRPLSRRPVTARRAATWSPDGKQYAYLAVVNAIVDPQPVLAVGQVDSGEERIIPITGPQTPGVVNMTWVGDSVYLNRVFSIERVVVETGARTTLASFPPDRMEIGVISPALGASDLLVFFVEPGTTGSRRVGLLRVDTLTGRSTEIASRVGRVMALSPDGSTLAVRAVVQDVSEILIRPVHGGEWKQVARLPQPPPAAAPATANGSGGDFRWAPDGKALWIVREEPGADSSQPAAPQAVLLRVPLDGGPVQKLAEPARLNRMDRVQLHPNGRQAMFHTFTYRYELWSVKNYLPGAASR